MPNANHFAQPRPRPGAIAVTIALHVLLLLAWRAMQMPHFARQASETRTPIFWLPLLRPPAVTPPAPTRPPPKTSHAAIIVAAPPPPPQSISPPVTPEPSFPTVTPLETPAPAARSADDILQQARRDVGQIDRALRAASPSQLHAPADTPQTRLAAGIEAATVAPKWYEAPRITSVADQGGHDRRIYKVVTAAGTYCITVESNHAPDGSDIMRNGIHQKITNCPRE